MKIPPIFKSFFTSRKTTHSTKIASSSQEDNVIRTREGLKKKSGEIPEPDEEPTEGISSRSWEI